MVIQPKIGVFAGIFDDDGKLYVKQRGTDESLPGEWDLPGGGVEQEDCQVGNERALGEALLREIEEETGMKFPALPQMPSMYPALLGDKDLALAIIIGKTNQKPTRGNGRFLSLVELEALANAPEGNRLVSGYGKRMHRLCLRIFASRDSPNQDYRGDAGAVLSTITKQS